MLTGSRLFIALLFLTQLAQAQLYLRAYHYRPTGEYGFVFKPGFSAEVGYAPAFEEKWTRFNLSATASFMQPRLKTIPTYAVMSSNTTVIVPAEYSMKQYNVYQVFFGLDVAVVKTKRFFGYIGTDLTLGGADIEYTNNVRYFISESYTGSGYLVGGRFRLGLQYDVNEYFSIITHVGRTGFLVIDPAATGFSNTYGIGLKYMFE